MKDRHHRHFNFSRVNIQWPVLFHDDMSGAFLWNASGTGADYNVDYDTTTPLIGAKCLRIYTKLTGPAADDYARATKALWMTPYKRLNIQFAFCRYGTANSYVSLLPYWYDGTNAHAAGIRFLWNEGTVQYLNSGATWTAVDSFVWNTAATYRWNFVSLTLDLVNHIYIQATVQHQFASMETINYAVSASANAPELDINLDVTSRAAARAGAVFDQIIVRADNP